jgi:hypothetical protein
MALFSGPVIVAIACFGSFTIAGNTLTTTQAYTALAFFSLLRFPMSFLPMLITSVVNALVALKRIQGFLIKPEADIAEQDAALVTEPGVVRVSCCCCCCCCCSPAAEPASCRCSQRDPNAGMVQLPACPCHCSGLAPGGLAAPTLGRSGSLLLEWHRPPAAALPCTLPAMAPAVSF